MKRFLMLTLAITLISTTSYATPIITTGLVGAWEFSGNAYDSSGYGNDAIVHGATLSADRYGNADSAYSFDGVNDWMEVIHSGILNFDFMQEDYSFSVWLNITDTNYQQDFFQDRGPANNGPVSYNLSVNPPVNDSIISNTWDSLPQNYEVQADASLIYGSWHHVVMVSMQELGKCLYIDGELVDSVIPTVGGTSLNTTNMLTIGAGSFPEGIINYTNGQIDDLYIFNRALSVDEIATLGGTVPAPEPSTFILLGAGLLGILGLNRKKLIKV